MVISLTFSNVQTSQFLKTDTLFKLLLQIFPEFDKFLEEHKHELQKIETFKEDVTEAELEIQEMDLEQADQEVI